MQIRPWRKLETGIALSDSKAPLSKLIMLVFSLAALDVIFAIIPLVPYGLSAAVLLKPPEGILVGTLGGPLTTFIGGIVSNIIWPSTAVLGLATWVPGVVGAFGAGMFPSMFIPYTFLDAGVRVLVGIVCGIVLTPVLIAVEKANLLKWPLT